MKGLFHICLAIAPLIFTSCLKDALPQQEEFCLDFSVEEACAKVTQGSGYSGAIPLLWEAGDRMDVNGVQSESLSEGGSSSTTFIFSERLAAPFKALYPASAAGSVGSSFTEITLPATQNSRNGMFDRNACILIGNGNDTQIRMSHAMAYIAFVFEKGSHDAVLKSLDISAVSGEKLSGGFTTDYSGLSAKGDASSSVNVSCDAVVGTEEAIVVALPAQSYTGGFRIRATDSEGRVMTRRTEGGFNAAAGHFYTTELTWEPDPDTPDQLYIGGSSMPWEWDLTDPRAVVPEVERGVYLGIFTFDFGSDAQNGFKFWETTGYGTEYGMATDSRFGDIRFGLRTDITGAPDNDPQFYLGALGYASGEYTLTIDFNEMSLTLSQGGSGEEVSLLCDKDATDQTGKLYSNMMRLAGTGTMFGAQMPTSHGISYTSSWTAGTYETDRSDTKALTGSHPALCGWEMGHIENGASANLDGVSFEKIRAHIIAAYERGAVNTISWHCNNPVTDGRYNEASDSPLSHILPGGSHHGKFLGWLDKAAGFLLSLKTSDGTLIPVIFRPWHEHTDRGQGSGFWWSVGNNSRESYIELWKMTFDYLTVTKGVHNLIWAYSPDLHHLCWNETGLDKYMYMDAWPGDEYVDILGLDAYQTAYSNFDASVEGVVGHAAGIAQEKGKLFAITETGLSNNNPGHYKYFYNEHWWTGKLYPLVSGRRVSYVMVWRNDGYPVDGQFPEYYNAFPGSYSTDDFLVFAGKDDVLLENDLGDMYE